MYGKLWADMWAGVPLADVKDAWASEMAGVTAAQIGAALKGVGKFPPTLPEFVVLCKPSAIHAAHRLLPSPQYEAMTRRSELVGEQIARTIGEGPRRDPKKWARDLIEAHERGDRLLPIQIQFAREALGLDRAERAAIQDEAA